MYRIDRKIAYRQVWVNNVDPGQTAPKCPKRAV